MVNKIKCFNKVLFANVPQTVLYILIYIFCCVSSLMFSVLFWNSNVVIDKESFIGVNIDLLLSDVNGFVLTMMIVGMELYKINDSFTVLRLKSNNATYKTTKLLSRVFLCMSVIASISFLVINKEGIDKTTPIESMVNTLFSLFEDFDIKVFTVIILSSVYSVLVEIGIIVIPSRMKVIWFGDIEISDNVEGINNYKKIKNKICSGIKDKLNFDIYKSDSKRNKDSESIENTDILDINISNSYKDVDKKDNEKIINLQKRFKENLNKCDVDINILSKVINYLEKVKAKNNKDVIKVNVENLKANCHIDHNKWNKVRNKLLNEGYVYVTKRLTYYKGKKVKAKSN